MTNTVILATACAPIVRTFHGTLNMALAVQALYRREILGIDLGPRPGVAELFEAL